jgi:CheY-like chemotaxis protein
MEKAAVRATSITNQLLTFAKGGQPMRAVQSLEPLIRDAVEFSLRGSKCVPQIEIASGLPPVNADSGQLVQVFHNLLLNAVQAMSSGGIIQVNARLASSTEIAEARLDPAHQGPLIVVEFIDEGTGISLEHHERLFSPYFTTKATGTGLGLATAYSIIQKHEGTILFHSRPETGSRFSVLLPATPQDIESQPEHSLQDAPGGEVLVMDDDATLRRVLTPMLESLGYEVTWVADGAELLEVVRDRPGNFDVILMDLTIPGGMGGEEAIKHLRALDPDVPVAVISGYSNAPVLSDFTTYGFDAALQKPFTRQHLEHALATIHRRHN